MDGPEDWKRTARDMTIYASDLDKFLYCRRNWWYRWRGVESDEEARMAEGTRRHDVHTRRVQAAEQDTGRAQLFVTIVLILIVLMIVLRVVAGSG